MTDATRTGAALFVETLERAGIDTIYGVPGEETTALMAAISDSSAIEFVLCRHEQSAAFMASVHGRITGCPGVCLSTLGPGATNLVTGVADAQLDHAPLIAISGQGARDRMGRRSHQMIDLEALFAPVTKMSRTILSADDIPATLAEALRISQAERPGAVHLSLPEDVADATTTAEPVAPPPLPTMQASSEDLSAVADRVLAADRPVIVAGAGCLRDGASDALRRFAEAAGVPVATTFMAKGILPPDHPLMLYSVGQGGEDWIDLALQAADLILLIGFDAVEYAPQALIQGGTADICVIDSSAPRADTGVDMAAQAIGDITLSLDDLASRLDGRQWIMPAAFEGARDSMRRALARRMSKSDTGPVAPTDICRVVSDQLGPEDTVLSGVGMHKLWIARHLTARRPGQLIIPNGLAGMGLALPGAVAAARLRPEGRVLALCGDGDVMMNVQEMETITRLSVRLTVMVWVDGGLGLIDAHQGDEGPTFPFGNPLWRQLANAFGWTFAAASGLQDLPDLLEAANAAEGPTLLTVPVDYEAVGRMPSAADEISGNKTPASAVA